MKTPYDFLARLAPKPTPEEVAEAQKLGISPEAYRARKLQARAGQAPQANAGAEPPRLDDITAEANQAQRLRSEPGLFKRRNTPPSLLVQAAKTPGEVAKLILFVFCYLVGLILLVTLGGENVTKMPGLFQCVLLGVLILPAMWATDRIWEAIGERTRDAVRLLVRFWPLTLVALVFLLGFVQFLRRGLH
jgi:hypothetical protein